jgi:mannose-6-phosphate isomerase-like protein (cupin superfamily)
MTYIDPTRVSPGNYRALLENDEVRVVEMVLRPGEKDEWHSHPNETVYFVKGSKVRIGLEDGGVLEADLPDGHVMWHEAWTHQVENVGSSELKAIIVERKSVDS